jgi:hypothetical protein
VDSYLGPQYVCKVLYRMGFSPLYLGPSRAGFLHIGLYGPLFSGCGMPITFWVEAYPLPPLSFSTFEFFGVFYKVLPVISVA